VTATIVRRVRLPAHQSSPGAARAAVRAVIVQAGLEDVADEALLLTTELSTNSVVHARTDLEVEIVADPTGLTVTVMDQRVGPLTSGEWVNGRRGAGSSAALSVHELGERGRGLLLVDQLSSCWGTLHYPTGKGVWFRLDRPGALPRDASEHVTADALTRRNDQTSAALALLAGSVPTVAENATLTEIGDDLLRRVCDLLGAGGAVALIDEGSGDGRGAPGAAAAHPSVAR
jgi:sigma-B regulation protein RsbU (phosphoserine phosphatase)